MLSRVSYLYGAFCMQKYYTRQTNILLCISIIYYHPKLGCFSNIQRIWFVNICNCSSIRKSHAPRTHPGTSLAKNIRNRVRPNIGYSLFVQAIFLRNIQRNIASFLFTYFIIHTICL